MLGLNRKIVKLIPYQKQWHNEFIKEKNFLLSILGDSIVIEHVGSTAIPGSFAKPIIDVALGLSLAIQADLLFTILSENGYENKGDDGVKGENLFVKGLETHRTHYLHIVEINSTAWKNYLAFRDYLREYKSARDDYNLLKQELAKKYSNSRESYTNGKAVFINKILQQTKSRL